MRSRPPQRTRLARAWLLVLALIAGSTAHGCLLPELLVETDPSSGGAPDDGTGAMGGQDGETTGGGSSAGGDSGSDGSGGVDDGAGGSEDGSGGGDAGGGGSGAGGEGTGGEGTGGEGTGGAGTGGAGTGGVSAGCGTQTSLLSGNASIVVGAETRDYTFYIPPTYTESTAYRLVFAFHPYDSTGPEIDAGGYFGLRELANETAVFVAPTAPNAWTNTNNQDLLLVEALVEEFSTKLCIDESRIFAVGFSAGGVLTNLIGCDLAQTFRAIAPIAGSLLRGCNQTLDDPIATWTAHGVNDATILDEDGEEAVAVFRDRNGCAATTSAVDPVPCVAYEDCDEDYPVHYCSWNGGHEIPSFAAQGIWDFFSQL